MGRPSKYPRELRERAVRIVTEVQSGYPSEYQAMTAVTQMLGVDSPETIRTWIRRQQVDAGERPGITTEASWKLAPRARERRAAPREQDFEGGLGFLRDRTRPAT